MSAGFALAWPGSRALLGWWRELDDRKPQQLHVSRLLLHRVEALVSVTRSQSLDRWQRAFLHLAHARLPHRELRNAFDDLQIDPQVLGQLLRQLMDAGLLHRNGSGLWQLTPAGQLALEKGALSVSHQERRTFHFVDNSPLGLPPHFLPLLRPLPSVPQSPSAEIGNAAFEIGCLQSCLEQAREWKARFHFPADVDALLPPRRDEPARANWQRVILDALQQHLFLLVHTTEPSGPIVLGYPLLVEGWTREPEPLFALGPDWQGVLPDVAREPTLDAWRQSWKNWTQPRGLPVAEVEACRLERVGHRLLIHASPRLIDRLRSARSDAVKQEAWLLAGEGRTRTAAQIELHPL